MPRKSLITLLLLSLAFAAGCGSMYNKTMRLLNPDPLRTYPVARTLYPYTVKIFDYNGTAGYGQLYFISLDSVFIVLTNDYGYKNREIFAKAWADTERPIIKQALERIDVEALDTAYVNPRVADGLQMAWEFRTPTMSKRVIVCNEKQDTLAQFCDVINPHLPKGFPLSRPSAFMMDDTTRMPQH